MLKEALSKMPDAFETKSLVKGRDYFQKGFVLNIRLSEGLLKGRIKDISNQIYDVHMDLKAWPEKPARCTCPQQLNCAHAAACLFALIDREKLNIDSHSAERLDKKLDAWLKTLRIQESITDEQQTQPEHQLVYLIGLKKNPYGDKVIIELAMPKILKQGGYGKKQILNSLPESKRQYLNKEDQEIIAQLFFKCHASSHFFHGLTIRNSELLEKILKTKRAFFNAQTDQAIKIEPLEASCQWELANNGNQYLRIKHKAAVLDPLLLDEAWYVDHEKSLMGPIETPYSMGELRHLLEAPPLTIEQAALLHQKMIKTCPNFPAPRVFKMMETEAIQPQACLILDAFDKEEGPLFVANIRFQYHEGRIDSADECASVFYTKDDKLIQYPRDKMFEQEKLNEAKRILKLRLMPEALTKPMTAPYLLQIDLESLYQSAIPKLKQSGWLIEFASDLYQEVLHADEVEWFSELDEKQSNFFSYQLGILVDGHPVNIVPLVAKLIQDYKGSQLDKLGDDEPIQLPLKDNRILKLPLGRIKPLIRLLLQIGLSRLKNDEPIEINKYQFLLMREIELAVKATKARWKGGERLQKELLQLIKGKDFPHIPKPKGLQTQLRDYQQHGLNWLQLLRLKGFGGILADDMGLGKTIQTLAHLQVEKEQGRLNHASLIIAPTSLVGNWEAECKRFTPNIRILVYHGLERHQDDFNDYDLIISTYGLIQRDKEKFIAYPFYYLILDESQFIKNARAKTTQMIQQVPASHRLCLTGTPLENHLGELWSLFHFLMPGLLGDATTFRQWFRTPIEKHADLNRRELLIQRVKPFMLRRTKNQVARELPSKTEVTHAIELHGAQRDLYEAIRMSMEKKVRDAIAKQGLGKSHILLLDALLKLRQVCCDPRLLNLEEADMAKTSSAKLQALMELLDNLVEEGRRVLVFSQFTSMLSLIEQELSLKNYSYLKLTGQTKNRQALVERFQQGETSLFLISLKAGGTGLNLTKADTVIHYDPWWNPAVEDQATDRSHRIGQENPVFVYKLIGKGTVEEAILKLQEKKRQLVNGILSSEFANNLNLSEQDIAQFFIPLD